MEGGLVAHASFLTRSIMSNYKEDFFAAETQLTAPSGKITKKYRWGDNKFSARI